MMGEENNNKESNWVLKRKGKPIFERDATPKDDKESIERYIDNIPDIFVDKYEKYLNTHKEDDELTRRRPDDFDRSVRVLPVEENGERYLRMVATDEKKTQDLHQFLKEGNFMFENEIIDGVGRENVIDAIKKRVKENIKENFRK